MGQLTSTVQGVTDPEWDDPPEVPGLDPSDRLFVDDATDWQNNACLNFGYPEIGYVEGFKKAADLAVDHVVNTARDQDYLVYPIVFGYRQYLELRLKGLLRDVTRLLDRTAPATGIMGQHRLIPLWDQLHPLLLTALPDGEDAFGRIRPRLHEFEELDPHSYAFRYATTKKGTKSVPEDVHRISLTHLRATMAKVASHLDDADMAIGAQLDHKDEMAQYYADEAAEWGDPNQ